MIETMTPRMLWSSMPRCAPGRSPAPMRARAIAIAIAAYLGKNETFDQAIAEFSVAYANQNERDYAALVEAVKSGRIKAETGV